MVGNFYFLNFSLIKDVFVPISNLSLSRDTADLKLKDIFLPLLDQYL